jgi:hypothetical protein
MMRWREKGQGQFFYSFDLDRVVPHELSKKFPTHTKKLAVFFVGNRTDAQAELRTGYVETEEVEAVESGHPE